MVPCRLALTLKAISDTQEEGLVGRLVGGMIRRTVRSRFRNVYWQPPAVRPTAPCIFAATHHGWHDGYVMFHLVTRLGLRSLDWIQEFEAFPLFARAGGMPFPADRPGVRAATIKRTIRLMNAERRSLILFPEGVLHEPPEIWPLGESLTLLMKRVPEAEILPVALVYRMSTHERPEAFVRTGTRLFAREAHLESVREAMMTTRNEAVEAMGDPTVWEVLAPGTPDVNERWDFRKKPGTGKP